MATQMMEQQVRNTANGIQLATEASYGPVTFFNSNLITEKTMAIMQACLDDPYFEANGHGLFAVIMREDGFPRGELLELAGEDDVIAKRLKNTWRFYPEAKAAVCNILECISSAIEDTQNESINKVECYGVYALTWKNILQGFFHEAYHAHSFLVDNGRLWDALEMESDELTAIKNMEEKAANTFAKDMMIKLAKTIDIEPEFPQSVVDLIDLAILDGIEKIEKDGNASDTQKRWATIQKYLRNNGGAYYDPRIPGTDSYTVHLKTFKSLMHHISRDAEDDPAWNAPTTSIRAKLVQSSNIAPITIDAEYREYEDTMEPDITAIAKGFEGIARFTAPTPIQPVAATPVVAPAATPVVTPVVVAPVATPVAAEPWVAPWTQAQTVVQPIGSFNPNVVIEPGQNAYPPINLPAGIVLQDVIDRLYLKLFMHIFRDCRYNQKNLARPFEMAGNICNPVVLDPHEALFVKEMTCIINGEKTQGVKSNGQVIGCMMDGAGRLPGYELTLSTPDGQQIKRKFIPQNNSKTKKDSTEYTPTALQAQNGDCIMWVMDPTVNKGFNTRVLNAKIQQNVNGQWV